MLIQVYLFIVSVLVVVVLVLKRVSVALAILASFLLYSIPLLGFGVVDVVLESLNYTMFNTVASLVSAMIFANIYRETKAAGELVESLEYIGAKTAAVSIPAIIGLLPMPAGAYISATMIDPVYTKMKLDPYEKTFTNYWFRHIWITIWPLYQTIIIASALLGISYTELLEKTWPIALASLLSGIVVFTVITRGRGNWRNSNSGLRGLLHTWPFILLAILLLVASIPLYIALAIVIAISILVYRVPRGILVKAVKRALDPSLITLIVISLMYGKAIEKTRLAEILVTLLSNWGFIAMLTIPLLIVFATGFEFTYVALGFRLSLDARLYGFMVSHCI